LPFTARQIEHAAQDERMKLRYHERVQRGACKRSNRQDPQQPAPYRSTQAASSETLTWSNRNG